MKKFLLTGFLACSMCGPIASFAPAALAHAAMQQQDQSSQDNMKKDDSMKKDEMKKDDKSKKNMKKNDKAKKDNMKKDNMKKDNMSKDDSKPNNWRPPGFRHQLRATANLKCGARRIPQAPCNEYLRNLIALTRIGFLSWAKLRWWVRLFDAADQVRFATDARVVAFSDRFLYRHHARFSVDKGAAGNVLRGEFHFPSIAAH
jgi:pentapeptide MXKDX repeat protein